MKVLTIEAAFELPANFKGDVPMALRLLAERIRLIEEERRVGDGAQRITEGESHPFCPRLWASFCDRPRDAFQRVSYSAGISEVSNAR